MSCMGTWARDLSRKLVLLIIIIFANIVLYIPSLAIRYKMTLLFNFLAKECCGSFMQQIFYTCVYHTEVFKNDTSLFLIFISFVFHFNISHFLIECLFLFIQVQ